MPTYNFQLFHERTEQNSCLVTASLSFHNDCVYNIHAILDIMQGKLWSLIWLLANLPTISEHPMNLPSAMHRTLVEDCADQWGILHSWDISQSWLWLLEQRQMLQWQCRVLCTSDAAARGACAAASGSGAGGRWLKMVERGAGRCCPNPIFGIGILSRLKQRLITVFLIMLWAKRFEPSPQHQAAQGILGTEAARRHFGQSEAVKFWGQFSSPNGGK